MFKMAIQTYQQYFLSLSLNANAWYAFALRIYKRYNTVTTLKIISMLLFLFILFFCWFALRHTAIKRNKFIGTCSCCYRYGGSIHSRPKIRIMYVGIFLSTIALTEGMYGIYTGTLIVGPLYSYCAPQILKCITASEQINVN